MTLPPARPHGCRPSTAAGVFVLVALTACGGAATPKAAKSTLPLEEQLGLANFGEAPPLQEALVIRDCMKAQGFDYVPVDPAAQNANSGTLSSATRRKLYGYDVSTRFGQPRPSTPPDPNVAIRAALSKPNQVAYDAALVGATATTNSNGGNNGGGGSFRTVGGCTKKAVQQVYGGAQVVSTLLTKLHTLSSQVDNDQRVVKANQAWSQCMQTAGFHYAKPSKIKKDLKKQLKAIVGSTSNPTATYDHAALAALQQKEMAISSADLSCDSKSQLTKIKNTVQAEYEAAFRQSNAPLLAQVKVPGARG